MRFSVYPIIIHPVTAKHVETDAISPTKNAATKFISPFCQKLGNIFIS